MKLQIAFNSTAVSPDLKTGWGFSCLVDGRVLFDTGENAHSLLNNLDRLGADMGQLGAVVISHDHWDHTGGLEAVLAARPGLPVYVCPHFSADVKQKILALKGNLKECGKPCGVAAGMAVTGEVLGEYKDQTLAEQALVLKTDNGLTVNTGCAHPGILEILSRVRRQFPDERIHAVLGGFHLRRVSPGEVRQIVRRFLELGVRQAGPTHCSGPETEKIFKELYGENGLSLMAGESFTV